MRTQPFGTHLAIGRRWPITRFVLRRLAAGAATLFVVSVLIFGAIQIIPGDVIQIVLGRSANPASVARVEKSLNLQDSIPVRYLTFVEKIATGDLGESTAGLVQGVHTPVAGFVLPALRNSMILAFICIALFIPATAVLGLVSGYWAGRGIDHSISTITLAIAALPEFIIGTGAIVLFFTQLDLFSPVSQIPNGDNPLNHLSLLVLPVITLLLSSLAFGSRLLRASVIDVSIPRERTRICDMSSVAELTWICGSAGGLDTLQQPRERGHDLPEAFRVRRNFRQSQHRIALNIGLLEIRPIDLSESI